MTGFREVEGRGPNGLTVASLRRRLLAGLVDALLLSLAIAGAFGLGFLWTSRRTPRGELPGVDASSGMSKWFARWGPALQVYSVVIAVLGRNSRGPGARLLGIRRADARTGDPVGVHSALVLYGATHGWSELIKQVCRPFERQSAERREALDGELRRIEAIYPSDLETRQQATLHLYKVKKISPFGSCLWRLAALMALQAPKLWSPLRQSLPERLAGVVVVRD